MFSDLEKRVIHRGLCTGCGTCVGVCPLHSIGLNEENDEPEPMLKGECNGCGICYQICPGAEVNIPELESLLFDRRNLRQEGLGTFIASLRGYATDLAIREKAASGGIISAILIHALEKGVIDCALVAGYKENEPWRAEPKIAQNRVEILNAAGSKQVVVPINSLLGEALRRGYSKIGIVGLPCHIHAIRKMQRRGLPESLSHKIKLVLGLFCAAGSYYEGTRHILRELGKVDDFKDIKKINYRGGDWPTYFMITLQNGQEIQLDRHFCSLHMLSNFKRDRCLVCIDWASELADLVGGDYWGVSREEKPLGTSMCLIRSQRGEEIMASAVHEKIVTLEPLDPFEMLSNFGFEVKKHGAMFRLGQRRRFGVPTPNFHYTSSYEPLCRPFHIAPGTGNRVRKPGGEFGGENGQI